MIFQNMLNLTMSALIKMLSPQSPAYNNQPKFSKQQILNDEFINSLKPGDIIFSRTNSLIYEVTRQMIGLQYDHVAVVINKKEVIHISPPIISKLKTNIIVRSDRYPLIYRPKLDDEQLQLFLSIMNGFLGEKYNVRAVGKILLTDIKGRLTKNYKGQDQQFTTSPLKYSRICSDAILYGLCRASQKLNNSIQQLINNETSYSYYGFILPDDLIKVMNSQNYQIIYNTANKHQKSMIINSVYSLKSFNLVQKCKNIKQLIQNKSSNFISQIMKLGNKLKNLQLGDKIQKRFGNLQRKYFEISLVIGLVLQMLEFLGFSVKSNSLFNIFRAVITILMLIGFYIVPKEYAQRIIPYTKL